MSCDGHSLKLPRTEFLILSRLARSADRIVPAEDLGSAPGVATNPSTWKPARYIYRLRNKLAPFKISLDTMVMSATGSYRRILLLSLKLIPKASIGTDAGWEMKSVPPRGSGWSFASSLESTV